MKTLFLVSLARDYGGAERSLELIAAQLQADIRLTIFAQNQLHIDALRRTLRPPSQLVAASGPAALTLVWILLKFAAAFIRVRPDAVLGNTHRSAFLLACMARILPRLKCRTFVYVRDFGWHKQDFIFSILNPSHVLVPHPVVLERPGYLERYVAPEGTLICAIVPDMVRVPETVTTKHEGGGVLHLAAIAPLKGHHHLIGAARLLRSSGRSMHFLSCGITLDESYRQRLRQQLKNAVLDDLFHLRGPVSDPSRLLQNCLCVAVTSVSHSGGPEMFGRTIIESWAHGKPVVAFAAGAPRQLIEHEVDGLLVPEGDEQALADALWRLYKDRGLRRLLGKNGLAKVRQNFEVQRVCDDLVAAMCSRLPLRPRRSN